MLMGQTEIIGTVYPETKETVGSNMPEEKTELVSQEAAQQNGESSRYSFSQEDVNRIVAKERKRFEQELASRPAPESFQELQRKLEAVSEEKELAGKSQMEKIQHQYMKDLEKRERHNLELQKRLESLDNEYKQAQETLRNERTSRAFRDALLSNGVHAPAAEDALKVLMSTVRDVEQTEDGRIKATFGKLMDEEPAKIAQQFLRERPFYASASSGGAGTRPSNGSPIPKNIGELGADQLWELAGQFK
jgi:hypothetical protein